MLTSLLAPSPNAFRRAIQGLLTAVTVALFSLQSTGQQQNRGANWDSIAELPDWSGLWEPESTLGGRAEDASFTPEYAAMFRDYTEAVARGEIEDTQAANCVPPGVPTIMAQPYPIEFVFAPGKVWILVEVYSQWRQIHTDGRAHPEDPDLTFNGHSIGHWEGDTLVVDTIGLTPTTPMFRSYAMKHSDKMRVVEHIRLAGPETLELELTIHDEEALREPLTATITYGRHRDWTLTEYICQQNNRNFTTSDGKAGVILGDGGSNE